MQQAHNYRWHGYLVTVGEKGTPKKKVPVGCTKKKKLIYGGWHSNNEIIVATTKIIENVCYSCNILFT